MFKQIPRFEDYKINKVGTILKNDKIIKPFILKGYLKVNLHKDGKQYKRFVHRLVLRTFRNDKPNNLKKYQCNHKNGLKFDNRIANLEWTTSIRNHHHAKRLGLKNIRNQTRFLKDGEAWLVKKLLRDSEYSMVSIAKIFKVNRDVIRDINRNRTYKDIIL